MNIRQLQYFVAVADTLNFTKAAQGLYVSQTAVTQQIKTLEKELNLELFYRTKRHVELTPAGKTFLRTARGILQELQESITRCHNLSTGITGSLTISIVKDYVAVELVDVLDKFWREYPNISLHFLRLSAGASHEALLTGKVDLAINVKFDTDNFPDMQVKELHHASLLAILSRSHALARKPALTLNDLRQENIFLLDTQSQEDLRIQQEMSQNLFPKDTSRVNLHYIPDVETIFFMAAANQGIGMVPDYVTMLQPFEAKIKALPLPDIGKPVVIAAEWKQHNANPSLPYLLNLL